MKNEVSRGLIAGLFIAFGVIAVICTFFFFAESDTSKANNAFAEADKYIESGDYDIAAAEYEKLIKSQPENKTAYSLLADLLIKMNETQRAKEVLETGYEKTSSPLLELQLQLLIQDSALSESR